MNQERKNNFQKTNKLKIPPHNNDAEMALLGSIMLHPENIHEISDLVLPEIFYADKHRFIFEAMQELQQKATAIDALSISTRLKEKDLLDRIGGMSYLAEITNAVPTSTNAKHYAEMVFKTHKLRQLIQTGEHLTSLGYDEERSIEEVIDEATKKVFEATSQVGAQKAVPIKEVMMGVWELIEKIHNDKHALRGVPTGFDELDKKLSGLQKADLVILAARPSVGKTSLALDIARNAAVIHKVPTIIFSLEMSKDQLIQRMLSAESKVPGWQMKTGKITMEEDFSRIRDAMAILNEAPIFIDDQAGNNILKMKSTARRLRAEHGLGLIVVDYLQLMSPTAAKNNDNLVQQVTEISRSLKQLAKELDVPVLALSQLSRNVENRGDNARPQLSDLRDSGSIEQDADVVMFIHREKDKENGGRVPLSDIMIEKHRNGSTGTIKLYFDGEKTSFVSIDNSNYAGVEIEADVNKF